MFCFDNLLIGFSYFYQDKGSFSLKLIVPLQTVPNHFKFGKYKNTGTIPIPYSIPILFIIIWFSFQFLFFMDEVSLTLYLTPKLWFIFLNSFILITSVHPSTPRPVSSPSLLPLPPPLPYNTGKESLIFSTVLDNDLVNY